MKKFNYKYLLILISLFILSFAVREYKQPILDCVKKLVSSELFFIVLAFLSFPINLVYKIKFNEVKFSSFLDATKIKESISEIIALVTEPSTFVCSISILKGLFLDYFYTDHYFSMFSEFEKTFLFIASFYFLIITANQLKNYLIKIIIDTTEVTKS